MFFLIALALSHKLISPKNEGNICACVGQTNLDDCKAQIENIDSITDCGTWTWSDSLNIQADKYYVTDEQPASDYSKAIFLTKNANLLFSSTNVFIKKNGVNTVVALSTSAQISISANGKFAIHYEEKPTDFILSITFSETVDLILSLPSVYSKSSININGKAKVRVRPQFKGLIDVFNAANTITFLNRINDDYDAICFSDNTIQCSQLMQFKARDFVQAKNYDEVVDLEKKSTCDNLALLVFKQFSISMVNDFKLTTTFFFGKGCQLTFDVPDETRLNLHLLVFIYWTKMQNALLMSKIVYILILKLLIQFYLFYPKYHLRQKKRLWRLYLN